MGYSPASVTHSLVALGRWMDRHDVVVAQLNDDVLKTFLADHVDEDGQLPTAGVMPLFEYLRREGVVPPEPARRRAPLDGFLDEYRGWLAVERALPPETVATNPHDRASEPREQPWAHRRSAAVTPWIVWIP